MGSADSKIWKYIQVVVFQFLAQVFSFMFTLFFVSFWLVQLENFCQNFTTWMEFCLLGPWLLEWLLEATISTSTTSIEYQFLAEYISFYMRYCLLVWNENGDSGKVILVLTQPCADSCVVITAQESVLPIADH